MKPIKEGMKPKLPTPKFDLIVESPAEHVEGARPGILLLHALKGLLPGLLALGRVVLRESLVHDVALVGELLVDVADHGGDCGRGDEDWEDLAGGPLRVC